MDINTQVEHSYDYAKAWAILLQAEKVDGVMELVNERVTNSGLTMPLDTPSDFLAYIIDEAETLEQNYSLDAEIHASACDDAAALRGYETHLRALGVMPSLLPWQRVHALLYRAEVEHGLLRMLARRVTITDVTSIEVIHGILAHAERYLGGSGAQIEAAHTIARRIIELGYTETP